jgi:polyphosphate kinase
MNTKTSQAGVDIELIIRGGCALRPGVRGTSNRIHVRSIVGRFLEHSRIFYFANGGRPPCFLPIRQIMNRFFEASIPAEVRR